MPRPIVLQLGDDIRWNHELYAQFQAKFEIRRSYSMSRPQFMEALRQNAFGPFVAIYRPFWNTGGEMGNWDDELISLLPSSCKIYASAGAGFDWVDTKALAKRGVIYCNSAAACTESVADAAIWLILSTFRLFSWSSTAARSTDAKQFIDANRNIAAVTRNPNGSKLGIVGLGRIGRRIAEKAYDALGMEILYHDVVQMSSDIEQRTRAKFYKSLVDLLAVSDCVVLATPFDGKTLFDEAMIDHIKTGAKLINIARGKLLNEDALVKALKRGQISAAGLDVHWDEPNVNPELAKMKNVEVTSHNAGASVDSHIGFERLGMENILSYFETGKALTPVNLQWLETGPSSKL